MAKPTSETAIANLSLSHLKVDPVLSISPPDSDNPNAAIMAKWYDQARRHTLEDHPWNFAMTRVTIASDADSPAFEYDTRYQLPSNFIRLGRLGLDWDNPERDYEIEGDWILCDIETPLNLVYVWDIEQVSKFSPKFITTLSYRLAADAGYEITGNSALVEVMEKQYQAHLTSAAAIDGQNRPTRRVQRSRFADARRNTSRFRDWQMWGDN